jgi:hypothetical protein
MQAGPDRKIDLTLLVLAVIAMAAASLVVSARAALDSVEVSWPPNAPDAWGAIEETGAVLMGKRTLEMAADPRIPQAGP